MTFWARTNFDVTNLMANVSANLVAVVKSVTNVRPTIGAIRGLNVIHVNVRCQAQPTHSVTVKQALVYAWKELLATSVTSVLAATLDMRLIVRLAVSVSTTGTTSFKDSKIRLVGRFL